MKRKGYLAVAFVFALTVLAAAMTLSTMRTRAQEADTARIEERILMLQNAYRTNAGLLPLAATDALMYAADVRAAESSVCFSHIRPDGSIWWTVEPDFAYGENLAYGYATADDAVSAWMASPEHMYNILNPSYRTCGVGVIWTGGTWYYVMEFGY